MVTQFEDLKEKDVQLVVKFKNDRRDYFYHGKVLEVTPEKVWLDDMIIGRVWFFRSQIYNFRTLEYHDLVKLAPKSERARIKFKLAQADDKIIDAGKKAVKFLKGG